MYDGVVYWSGEQVVLMEGKVGHIIRIYLIFTETNTISL